MSPAVLISNWTKPEPQQGSMSRRDSELRERCRTKRCRVLSTVTKGDIPRAADVWIVDESRLVQRAGTRRRVTTRRDSKTLERRVVRSNSIPTLFPLRTESHKRDPAGESSWLCYTERGASVSPKNLPTRRSDQTWHAGDSREVRKCARQVPEPCGASRLILLSELDSAGRY